MMERYLIERRSVDPFYEEYLLSTAKPDVVDTLTQDTVSRFRDLGLQTAILTEAAAGGWRVACIAIALEPMAGFAE